MMLPIRRQIRRTIVTNTKPGIRLLLAATLLGGTALLAACGPDTTTQTTSTERTTTTSVPAPATTVTSTKTQQYTP
jgi:hypothetical protein